MTIDRPGPSNTFHQEYGVTARISNGEKKHRCGFWTIRTETRTELLLGFTLCAQSEDQRVFLATVVRCLGYQGRHHVPKLSVHAPRNRQGSDVQMDTNNIRADNGNAHTARLRCLPNPLWCAARGDGAATPRSRRRVSRCPLARTHYAEQLLDRRCSFEAPDWGTRQR